jgi:IclR family acetate operon transcriptional repressor
MKQNPVKSAVRVLHVLEFFDQARRRASVAEVAEHHGWPHSSTSVLMRSLVGMGYLDYDVGTRTYLPSMRVALLGDWLQSTAFPNAELLQLLEHLNQETGETIVLAAQNGLHAQYLRVLQGTNVLRMHLHIGALRPLLNSGTGRMLITTMDDATIKNLAKKHNAQFPDKPLNANEVLARLAVDREKGYAMSIHQVTPYSGVIATLLPTGPGQKPIAIGVAGLSQKLISEEERYVAAMRQAIRRYAVE